MSVRRTRSLWPREHGAYIQLVVPLVTSLIATWSWAGAAIGLGAVLAFLASEPLRVAVGGRGARRQALDGRRARSRLAVFGTLAVIAGGLGLVFAPKAAVGLSVLLVPLIGFVIVASHVGQIQTALGESLAAVVLTGAGAPVGIAGGMDLRHALVIWLGWSLAYAATVLAVHRVLARRRRSRVNGIAFGFVAVMLVGWVVVFPSAWFALPVAIAATLVIIWVPRATRLRAIGFGFLASSIVAASCAITTVRTDAHDATLSSFRAEVARHPHPH